MFKRQSVSWLIIAVTGLALILRGGIWLDSLFVNLGWMTSLKTGTTIARVAVPVANDWQECRSWDAAGFGKFLHGDPVAAIDDLQQAIKCNGYRRAWFDLGRAQFAAGLLNEAASSWRQAEAYDYAVQMASLISNGKDPVQTVRVRQFLLKVAPDRADLYSSLGDAYREAQCPVEALQTYQAALSLKIDEASRQTVQAKIDQINKVKLDNSKCLLPK